MRGGREKDREKGRERGMDMNKRTYYMYIEREKERKGERTIKEENKREERG